MTLTNEFAQRIDTDSGYDNLKLASDLEAIARNHFKSLENYKWIDASKELPPLIKGQDYSENVLALEADHTETQVFCLCFIPDPENEGEWHYVWANCYGKLDGDAEFDDNYNVTHWMPIPGGD